MVTPLQDLHPLMYIYIYMWCRCLELPCMAVGDTSSGSDFGMYCVAATRYPYATNKQTKFASTRQMSAKAREVQRSAPSAPDGAATWTFLPIGPALPPSLPLTPLDGYLRISENFRTRTAAQLRLSMCRSRRGVRAAMLVKQLNLMWCQLCFPCKHLKPCDAGGLCSIWVPSKVQGHA